MPDIHGGSSGGGVKEQWGWQRRQFSAFSVAISLEIAIWQKASIIIHDMQPPVGFSVILKSQTFLVCVSVRGHIVDS